MDVKRIRLDKIELHARREFYKRDLAGLSANVTAWAEIEAERMTVELSTYMVGLLDEVVTVRRRWPLDWQQAFKQRWFPGRWLKRWPVRMNGCDVEVRVYKCVCPHINVHLSERPASQEFHLMHMSSHLEHDPEDPV